MMVGAPRSELARRPAPARRHQLAALAAPALYGQANSRPLATLTAHLPAAPTSGLLDISPTLRACHYSAGTVAGFFGTALRFDFGAGWRRPAP